jgi:hypothetical protein
VRVALAQAAGVVARPVTGPFLVALAVRVALAQSKLFFTSHANLDEEVK